jgi:alpha-galactosidase
MLPTKIVIIGAGSASFGLNTLAALMRSKKLSGSHLALVDLNPQSLELVAGLAKLLNRQWDAQMELTTHNHHKEALVDAAFVVLSIEVPPREVLWRSDYEIPLKYNVRQPYAENGGPGGFAHAARNITPLIDIISDMEEVCPQALLINYTNPMTRICDAVARHSKIKVVGLCHQINAGYAMAGIALADDLGIDVPPGISDTTASQYGIPLRQQVVKQAQELIDIRAAGLNHFTWMLSIHDKCSGEDLYPLFAKRWRAMNPAFEPLTRQIYDIFGLFPIPGDEHLCEYLPWVSDPITKPWEKYDLSLYDWDGWETFREQGYADIKRMVTERVSTDSLRQTDSEGALEIIENIASAGNHTHLAVNLPNRGQITNLPMGSIVETPGIVTGAGVHGVNIGSLPEPIAELCRRELAVVQLCVDAAVHGDRQTALQCLLLDPVITDIDIGEKILEDYLITYREYLPQFWN